MGLGLLAHVVRLASSKEDTASPLESSARRDFYRLVSCTLEFRKAILLILRSLFPHTQGAKTAPLKL
jgi:hypothetical protein